MSILIKGMEMPVTCCHCQLMGYDPDIEWVDGGRETQGAYICVITHELIDNTKREEHCPLVPVPPHGDLIDYDFCMENYELLHDDDGNPVYAVRMRDINNAPAIIPEED